MAAKKRLLKERIVILVLLIIIVVGTLYYFYFLKPKNSLELYQELHFAEEFEEVERLILDGYEGNFTEDDFNYIQNHSPDRVGQYTLFEYRDKSYIIMTSPGTEQLKILAVEELPKEIREFFLGLAE